MFMSYMVMGVDRYLKANSGFDFFCPWRGPVEDKDWYEAAAQASLRGIDWDRYNYPITNDVYLVIEYDPDDGIKDRTYSIL
jgi:hypothetical protein